MAPSKSTGRQGRAFAENKKALEPYFANLGLADPRIVKSRLAETNKVSSECCWLITNPEFIDWRNYRLKRVLWINGEPGSGKTMQLCGVIDEMEKAASNARLSYFFCQDEDTAEDVLRGLIFMLVQQQPSLLQHIRLKHERKSLLESLDEWRTLSGIFTNILQDRSLIRSGVCFVVDGLDACGTNSRQLADLVLQTTSLSFHVKWIVSSRSTPEIQGYFHASDLVAELCFQSEAKAISEATSTYIRQRVHRVTKEYNFSIEMEKSIHEHIEKANGTFLWTTLACRHLLDVPKDDTTSYLQDLPLEVDSFYAYGIQNINNSSSPDLCKRILALDAVVYRPVNLVELSLFLDAPLDTSDFRKSIADAVRQCGAFLTFHDDTVYFVHSSAKDFLLKDLESSDSDFASSLYQAHDYIFTKSIEQMCAVFRRNIYDLPHPGTTIDQIQKPDPDPLEELEYSCTYWIHHLCCSYEPRVRSRTGVRDNAVLDTRLQLFLEKHYMYWLESLSLLRRLPEAIRLMNKLNIHFARSSSSQLLKDLVNDGYEFMMTNSEVISLAPLQTYTSALLFNPVDNLIRELYQQEQLAWTICPELRRERLSDHQDIGYHEGPVTSLALSPTDTDTVVSASDDKSLKIWKATTGSCVRTLRGHDDRLWSFSFSPDGKQIASASDDGTVKVWHLATGRCIETLDGNGDIFLSKNLAFKRRDGMIWGVAISHNGQLIATALSDGIVTIWDATTGESLFRLSHPGLVYVVAFWQNSHVASVSTQGGVKIWDTESGKCIETLQDRPALIRSMAYSHDGQYIATGGAGITIWNVSTTKVVHDIGLTSTAYLDVLAMAYNRDGTALAGSTDGGEVVFVDPLQGQVVRRFKAHMGGSWSIAFSKDGRSLVSGGTDGFVKIWDVGTGECIKTLDLNLTTIFSVAFTRSSQQVLVGLANGLVEIWNISTGMRAQSFRHDDTCVFAIAMSHDGRHAVTASESKVDLKLWDITSGGPSWSTSFSHNGYWLATCSDEGTVRIWETLTGNCLRALSHHSGPVYATAFSHDDQFLAAASGDRTVSISDMSGKCLRRLEGHRGSIWAAVFTPDDRQVVSSSNDRTVRIWNALSGQCLRLIHVGVSLSSIQIDAACSFLDTEIGRISLTLPDEAVTSQAKTTAAEKDLNIYHNNKSHDQGQVKQVGYGLSYDWCWITENGENVVLIPRRYRPLSSAVSKGVICLGCRSGHVLFISHN